MPLRPCLPFEPEGPKAKPVTAAQIKTMARKAVTRRAPGQSKMVTLSVRITITRERADQLSEESIRSGRNLEDVVGEIVEGDSA
jgi:hypothetical protein